MTNYNRNNLLLTGIFLAGLLILIVVLAEQGRYDYAKNIAVKASIWTIYSFFELKYNMTVPNYIRALVMVAVLSDSFIGLYLNLYVTSSVFDKIQHVYGSYAFSLFAFTILHRLLHPVVSRAFNCLLVILIGLSIGAVYEIGEFIGDLVARPQVPSQPSLLDTNLDLIADFTGALIAAVHVAFFSTIGRTFKL
ncbi:hypothetical protein [Sporomusa aerivorans]|uniref:hypothetical protein n=1 Tax=Sporomusa aerivorans TaxID=204936 RepID=UPI00352A8F94